MEYSPLKMQKNLTSHDFYFKKNYGQNFIIDRNVIDKIVESSQIDEDTLVHFASIMQNVADQSSSLERKAIDIEREVDDMKMAEYMEEHIGERFEGIISSITNFGMFVELPNTIEGLIRNEDLVDDYYFFDEVNLQLIGKRTGKRFKMSDKVKVEVVRASKAERIIDFKIVGMKSNKKPKKKQSKYIKKYHRENSKAESYLYQIY